MAPRRPPPDLDVSATFDDPLDRVDAAAFAARALAERLHERLAAHALACTRLGIEAYTARGEELCRTWRHEGLLSASAIADRVRWQLDGWLTGSPTGPRRPTAGIVRLRLVPDGVVHHAGLQQGLWGEAGEERDRAHRALTRVQGLLGPEAVRLVPWGDEREPARAVQPPWPGSVPAPAPATVLPDPLPAAVYAGDGAPVRVTERLALTGTPARVSAGDGVPVDVVGWAGPWPVDERWWAPAEGERGARFQLLLADGRALLLVLSPAGWTVEAVYD